MNSGVVLKSHLGSTAAQATLAQQHGLPVFASVALNQFTGGIDYRVVLRALAEYQPILPAKLIVDLPTLTGRHQQSKLSRNFSVGPLKEVALEPTTVFNAEKKLKPEVIDLIKFARDYPVVLSTGHASKEEVYALAEACDKYKLDALLLNQPANPLTGLTAKDLASLANHSFIWIEQTALTYLLGYQNDSDFQKVLTLPKRVVYSSDLGQTSQMDILGWQVTSMNWFTEFNLSEKRKKEICLTNPAQLLCL